MTFIGAAPMSAPRPLVEWRSSSSDGRDGSTENRKKRGRMSSYPGNGGRYRGVLRGHFPTSKSSKYYPNRFGPPVSWCKGDRWLPSLQFLLPVPMPHPPPARHLTDPMRNIRRFYGAESSSIHSTSIIKNHFFNRASGYFQWAYLNSWMVS